MSSHIDDLDSNKKSIVEKISTSNREKRIASGVASPYSKRVYKL